MAPPVTVCRYDPECYQKNPQHSKDYAHPARDARDAQKKAGATTVASQPAAAVATSAVVVVVDDNTQPDVVAEPLTAEPAVSTTAAAPVYREETPQPAPSAARDHRPQQPRSVTASPNNIAPASSPLRGDRHLPRRGDDGGSSPHRRAATERRCPFTAPEPRASPLRGSRDPCAVFEMAFPVADMQAVLDVGAAHAKTEHGANGPLRAFPGLTLCGPFEVLLGGAKFESDRHKWMFRRQPLHPPEVQTFAYVETELFYKAIGAQHRPGDRREREGEESAGGGVDDGHPSSASAAVARKRSVFEMCTLCFFRDGPGDAPFIVASHGYGGRDILPLFGDLGRIHAHVVRSATDASPACRALADKFGAAVPGAELKEFAAKRQRAAIARTISGVGMVVPFDKKADLGYREPFVTRARQVTILRSIAAGTGVAKEQAELDDQLNFADIANDECDFGLSLELGLNFFYHAPFDAATGRLRPGYILGNALRMLDVVYDLLCRDLFKHIILTIATEKCGPPAPMLRDS